MRHAAVGGVAVPPQQSSLVSQADAAVAAGRTAICDALKAAAAFAAGLGARAAPPPVLRPRSLQPPGCAQQQRPASHCCNATPAPPPNPKL
jgi:hypothetical protein